jgi:hypothetical protein
VRSIRGTVTVSEIIENNIPVVSEEFITINENKQSEIIQVFISVKSADGTVVKEEGYQIFGDEYKSLMSESPSFAPGKPANEYREVDLWHIIDSIRSRQ